MIVQTKILVETETGDIWEDYSLNLALYVCHQRDEYGSIVQLKWLDFPVNVQLSFEEITEYLQILNTFETVSLN